MLSDKEFVRQSLELNLFFMRIEKEHAIFLQAGLVTKDYKLIRQIECLKNIFNQLLKSTVRLSEGIISEGVATSGELVTDITLRAERETQCLSGIKIDSSITMMELNLLRSHVYKSRLDIVERVEDLNMRAMIAANQISIFKSSLLRKLLTCKLFVTNYTLLIEHNLREAMYYLRILAKLQNREEINSGNEVVYQERFLNRIMAEHTSCIDELLGKEEKKLFNDPKNFIAYPLLDDHVVREANHYIRLLKSFMVDN